MSCLKTYWTISSVCRCPYCKQTYRRRPDLKVNTLISGLAEQLTLQFCEKDQDRDKVQDLGWYQGWTQGWIRGWDQARRSPDSTEVSKRVSLTYRQQYAVDFVLDPDTAHPQLILSSDLKQVRFNRAESGIISNTSRRFLRQYAVVADRGFSGRFYFEVFVGQKDEWILGVAKQTTPRSIDIPPLPGSGLWALYFRVDKLTVLSCPTILVHRKKVERVGVSVDYDMGKVSFFDVKTATCLYAFTDCVFTEKLYPFLNPCDDKFPSNLGPMTIVPVIHE